MRRRLAALANRLVGLPPASFAFVMATGIVALAARQQDLPRVASAMFRLDALAWIALTLLAFVRIARDAPRLAVQLRDHAVAPGFLTAVAGTAVFAGGVIAFDARIDLALALGAWALLLWFVLTYGILAALTTREDKPTLEAGLNGTWLLAVVACQSIAVLCAMLSPQVAQPARLQLNFLALCMWLVAGMLYTWIIALIFYRYLFFRFAPAHLAPAYWINMGAMAISTLAGSLLIANAADAPLLAALLPFLKGFTILYWATGTWWLPMLVALTLWRYAVRRDPLTAEAWDWSMVFPLGMYSAATWRMAGALQLDFLAGLARAFCWIAIAAWLATFAAMLARAGRARA